MQHPALQDSPGHGPLQMATIFPPSLVIELYWCYFLTVMRTRIFNKLAVGSLVNRFFWRKADTFIPCYWWIRQSTQVAQCLGSVQPFWFIRLCSGPAPAPTPRDWASGSVKSCKLSLLPKERLPQNQSGWRAGMDQSCFLVYWPVLPWYEEHWEVKVNFAQY